MKKIHVVCGLAILLVLASILLAVALIYRFGPDRESISDQADSTPSDTWERNGVILNGFTTVSEDVLLVGVRVNTRERRVNFRTWSTLFPHERNNPVAIDSKGTRLNSRDGSTFAIQMEAAFQGRNPNVHIGTGFVDPDRQCLDMLFFDAPMTGATYVDLSLDGKNVELEGEKIRIRLPIVRK